MVTLQLWVTDGPSGTAAGGQARAHIGKKFFHSPAHFVLPFCLHSSCTCVETAEILSTISEFEVRVLVLVFWLHPIHDHFQVRLLRCFSKGVGLNAKFQSRRTIILVLRMWQKDRELGATVPKQEGYEMLAHSGALLIRSGGVQGKSTEYETSAVVLVMTSVFRAWSRQKKEKKIKERTLAYSTGVATLLLISQDFRLGWRHVVLRAPVACLLLSLVPVLLIPFLSPTISFLA